MGVWSEGNSVEWVGACGSRDPAFSLWGGSWAAVCQARTRRDRKEWCSVEVLGIARELS